MAAHQVPLSLGFSRQEHWSGLPFPSPVHESEKWKWSRSVVSDPQRPHGLQPSRLLHPWDFPGKSTEVGCHCLLHPHTLWDPKWLNCKQPIFLKTAWSTGKFLTSTNFWKSLSRVNPSGNSLLSNKLLPAFLKIPRGTEKQSKQLLPFPHDSNWVLLDYRNPT